MKIIEGLKRLKLIEKRMATNQAKITEYASKPSTEKPKFETDEEQKKEVMSRLQANHDLMQEFLKLKKDIEFTNLSTQVEIGGIKYAITDLLSIKRKLARSMINTFGALNDIAAQTRMRHTSVVTADSKAVQVERFYDERKKLEGQAKWQDLYDNIDSRLEVINATEDLKTFGE